MPFANPSDSTEILYGSSGDVRNEINAYLSVTTAGHYADETEIPGSLIVGSLRRATRLINTYLEPVHADKIPFTAIGDVPKMLDEVASDIAVFYVWRSAAVILGNISDQRKRDYFDQYVAEGGIVQGGDGFLVKISKGEIALPELTASSPDEANSARSLTRAPIFDLDDIKNHEVSEKLIDDIERDRDSG